MNLNSILDNDDLSNDDVDPKILSFLDPNQKQEELDKIKSSITLANEEFKVLNCLYSSKLQIQKRNKVCKLDVRNINMVKQLLTIENYLTEEPSTIMLNQTVSQIDSSIDTSIQTIIDSISTISKTIVDVYEPSLKHFKDQNLIKIAQAVKENTEVFSFLTKDTVFNNRNLIIDGLTINQLLNTRFYSLFENEETEIQISHPISKALKDLKDFLFDNKEHLNFILNVGTNRLCFKLTTFNKSNYYIDFQNLKINHGVIENENINNDENQDISNLSPIEGFLIAINKERLEYLEKINDLCKNMIKEIKGIEAKIPHFLDKEMVLSEKAQMFFELLTICNEHFTHIHFLTKSIALYHDYLERWKIVLKEIKNSEQQV